MNLQSRYLGFDLRNPIVCGASPIVDDPDLVIALEDAGVAAFVVHSLFEEDIERELMALHQIHSFGESFAEALSFFPEIEVTHTSLRRCVELIRRLKRTVSVPVIASLNGSSPGGWTSYARDLQTAGADALELNIYFLPTDPEESGSEIEQRCVEIVREVRSAISIPLAVKLSPFYSSFFHLARRVEREGADGLVLFNRFYQPDIDIGALRVVPDLHLSTSEELRLRLRWLAILSGRVRLSLAATGGVHTAEDVIKAVMAGADAVQMVSALLRHGPEHVRQLLAELALWMEDHEYESIAQLRGSMNLLRSPNPEAFERTNYVKVLHSWGE